MQKHILRILGTQRFHYVVSIDETHFHQESFLTYYYYSASKQEEEKYKVIRKPSTLVELFPEKTRNLNKNLLHIHQFPNWPFTRFLDSETIVGVDRFVIDMVSQKLNATLNMTLFPTSGFFATDWAYKNGADLCMEIREVQPQRVSHVQYSYPFQIESYAMLVLKKKATLGSLLLSLWNNSSWWFLVSIAMSLAFYWAVTYNSAGFNIFMDILRVLLLGSLPTMPERKSVRILMISLSIFCLIYMTIVQSQFTSLLAIPKARQISNLDEFLNEGYQYDSLPLNVTFPDYFSVNKSLRQKSSFDEFFQLNPKVGILTLSHYDRFIDLNIYHIFKEDITSAMYAQAYPLHAPFKETLDDVFARAFEAGLRQYMEAKLVTIYEFNLNKEELKEKENQLTQMIFVSGSLLILGLGTSLVVFFGEILWSRRRQLDTRKCFKNI